MRRESAARRESAKQSPLRSSGGGGWTSGTVKMTPGSDPTFDSSGPVRGGTQDTGAEAVSYEMGPGGELQRRRK